jgi:hypothetical protein
MGIAPASGVAGALPGRSQTGSAPKIETKPMSFDPEPPASSTADEPPPVQSAEPPPLVPTVTEKLPPPPLVDSPTPPAWDVLSARARSPAAAIALVSGGSLVMFAIVAGLVTFVAGSLRKCAVAAPASPSTPAAVEPPPASPPVESAPPVAPEVPTLTTHFSASAAKRAFKAASHDVAACKRGPRWGTANATVKFDPDGSVQHVSVGAPFGGTPTGQCVSDRLGAVHIPAFAGDPVVFVTPFYVAPR